MSKFSTIDLKKSPILVVDDQLINIRLLQKILTLKEYSNVIYTQDPTQVNNLHKKHQFDLILLDLDMPKLDGFGVMEQLNLLTDNNPPPILVLTAQHMQNYRQQALDNGARDYVTKPFDADELLSRVRNLLEVQLAHKYIHQQNELLEEKVQKRTKALIDTQFKIVQHLGRAAEYRDNETGLHVIRMSKMAVVIAKAFGMDDQQCKLLLYTAPMHDIGKIGIPDNILLKPGKLNKEEWEIMQTHAQIGADVLADDDSELIIMARQIALTHHEKWDGSGYPNQLKGENIPITGRICALADVFDALTSERPYKKAWTVNQTLDLIKQESGKHFEPKLVEILQKNLDKIIAIKQKYAEPENQKTSA
ncbi:MAG: two-component system response regulator [Gammaproteobacteria bacterium]|nr:MAG: two-component system response regulator [Gammaproteobacteria bacterium]